MTASTMHPPSPLPICACQPNCSQSLHLACRAGEQTDVCSAHSRHSPHTPACVSSHKVETAWFQPHIAWGSGCKYSNVLFLRELAKQPQHSRTAAHYVSWDPDKRQCMSPGTGNGKQPTNKDPQRFHTGCFPGHEPCIHSTPHPDTASHPVHAATGPASTHTH